MNRIASFLLLSLFLLGCKTKDVAQDQERLPKDVALMPERDYTDKEDMDIERDRGYLTELRASIAEQISSVKCSDPLQWRVSPLGSKACGGPASFIAYPIELEEELLPQISTYNQASSSFNLKYGIISDCSVTQAPAGIRCEEGVATLYYGQSALEVTQ
ncbi:hypothetical protein [Chryseobacterium sp. A301]